jgi:hypothetical protein
MSAPPGAVSAPPLGGPFAARDPFAAGTAPLPAGVPVPGMVGQVSHAPPPPPPSAAGRFPPPPSSTKLTPTPSRPSFKSISGGRRASGDELIADLFEAMGELHFFPDALEAGDFVLRLTLDMIPSHAALLHFYDINMREFVIACAHGGRAPELLLRRLPEAEPLLSSAMRKRRAVVVHASADAELASAERFQYLGGAKAILVSPVMKGGRFLGAIEVMNPSDGLPFTEPEGNALDYIAEQFAEYLAERGVVVDPERITRPRQG